MIKYTKISNSINNESKNTNKPICDNNKDNSIKVIYKIKEDNKNYYKINFENINKIEFYKKVNLFFR